MLPYGEQLHMCHIYIGPSVHLHVSDLSHCYHCNTTSEPECEYEYE